MMVHHVAISGRVVKACRRPLPSPQGALVMPLMAQGFKMGLIKFNIITARKP